MSGPVIMLSVKDPSERLKAVYEVVRWAPVIERVKGWKPFAVLGVFDHDVVTFASDSEHALDKLMRGNPRVLSAPTGSEILFPHETIEHEVVVAAIREIPSDNLLSFLMGA